MAAAGQKFCATCGEQINEKAEICPHCGVRQPVVATGGRNKIVAAVLAILLGWLGAHKFYLGQMGMGVLYLVFFWTGIPFVVGIIEGVIYLSMSDAAFHSKYNT